MPLPGRLALALAIVTGGIALGTMLGAAANPEMKMAPERPWQGALQVPVTTDGGYLVIEAAPEDLSPYPDRYAPTWAHEELADWEPDYPALAYSDLLDERLADPSAMDEPQANEQPAAVASEIPAAVEAMPQPAESMARAPEPQVSGNLAALY